MTYSFSQAPTGGLPRSKSAGMRAYLQLLQHLSAIRPVYNCTVCVYLSLKVHAFVGLRLFKQYMLVYANVHCMYGVLL